LLDEIIDRVNQLFEGDLTDAGKLIYVNHVLKEKLVESEILMEQAMHNSKERFANSTELMKGIQNAIIDPLEPIRL
jgi:type I restriction enzyme, R subunit